MTGRIKKDFTAYQMDYSVCVLRAEMKSLGRALKNNEGEWNEEYKSVVRFRMQQIKDTLAGLKVRFIK